MFSNYTLKTYIDASSLVTDTNDKVSSTLASSLVTDMVPILTIGVFNTMDLPMAFSFEADVHDKDSSTLTSSL